MKNSFFKIILFLLPLHLLFCSPSENIELFSIDNISPDVLEPGQRLIITGDGFVEGPATVELIGNFKPKGMKPSFFRRIVLSGKAISASCVEVRITTSTMEAIAKEPVVFEGEIAVSFPGKFLDSTIKLEAKTQSGEIEFLPEGGAVRANALRKQEARTLMALIGVSLDHESFQDEVKISDVVKNSLADEKGLLPGSRLLAIDGFPLTEAADLSGLNPSKEHTFEFVTPDGISGHFTARLDGNFSFQKDQFVAVLMTSLFIGLFLALILPFYKHSNNFDFNSQVFAGHAGGIILASILCLIIAALVINFHLGFEGTLLLTGLFFTGLIILFFYSNQTLLIRLHNGFTLALAFISIVVLGLANSNTLGIYEAILAQGNTDLALHIWKNPFYTLGCIFACSIFWPTQLIGAGNKWICQIAAWLLCVSAALSMVFFCLGGYNLPWLSISPSKNTFALLILIVAIKTWIVIFISRTLSFANRWERRRFFNINKELNLAWIPMVLFFGAGIFFDKLNLTHDFLQAGQMLSCALFFIIVSLIVFSRLPFCKKGNIQLS